MSETVDGYELLTLHTDTGKEVVFFCKSCDQRCRYNADESADMVNAYKLRITARKGEYCLLDKAAGTHVSHTIFQLPFVKMGKGVLVTPTIHGNLLMVLTAVDVTDKEAVNTTQEAGLDILKAEVALSVKDLPMRQVITSSAVLRGA